MFLRAIPVIALVTSLSACGGSSDGSAVNPTQPPSPSVPADRATVLETFDDGSGVLRSVTTADGFTFVINGITPSVQAAVNSINSGAPATVDLINEQFSSSNAYGEFYTGQIIVNGEVVNGVGYADYNGIVSIVYLEGIDGTVLAAGGEKVSNIPSGTYIYNGTNVIGNRDGSYAEQGTFAMGVDFNTGQASINGSTATSTIESSNISVNNSNGTFSSNNVTIGINGTPTPGTISGNFHGNEAIGVTGVYHDNGGNPVVAGAIAGTR
jgi:hypothetical protein